MREERDPLAVRQAAPLRHGCAERARCELLREPRLADARRRRAPSRGGTTALRSPCGTRRAGSRGSCSRPTSGESSRRKMSSAPARTSSSRQVGTASLLPLSESSRAARRAMRSRDEPVRLAAEQDLARLRRLLEARGDVDGVAGRDQVLRRRIADDDLAGVDPDAQLEAHAEACCRGRRSAARARRASRRPRERRAARRPRGRPGTPKTAITASPMNFSTVPPCRSSTGAHLVEVLEHHAPQRLRVDPLAEARRAR